MFAKTAVFAAVYLALAVVAKPYKRDTPLAQVISGCTVANTVALTFDDGPYIYLEDISNTLVEANATGTFFFRDCIYDDDVMARVKYAYSKGHQIASHTWSHPDLTTLSFDDIHNQMWLIEQALTRIIGIVPAFIRPPYGNYNDLVRQVADERGQKLVLWDFDSGDSTGSTAAQSEAAYAAIIAKHPSNLLPLNHETYSTTAYEVLPYAIKELKAAGYRLVSLSECLGGLPAYQSVVAPSTPDSTWTCNGTPQPSPD